MTTINHSPKEETWTIGQLDALKQLENEGWREPRYIPKELLDEYIDARNAEDLDRLESATIKFNDYSDFTEPTKPPLFPGDYVHRETYGCDSLEYIGNGENVDDDEDAWLVRGIVPAAAPSIIVGLPKSKKSLLMYSIGLCVAAGKPFLGCPTAQGRVLIISREDPPKETLRRLWQLARGLGIDIRKLVEDGQLRVDAKRVLKLDDNTYRENLHATMQEFKPTLLLIDSLSRVHSADEDNRTKMAPVTNFWNDLCSQYECGVCILHHMTKWGDHGSLIQRIRGSGDIGALVRMAVGVTKVNDHVSKVETDGNMAGMAPTFKFEISDKEADGHKQIHLNLKLAGAELETGSNDESLSSPLVSDIVKVLLARGDTRIKDIRSATGVSMVRVTKTIKFLEKERIVQPVMQGLRHMGYRLTSDGNYFANNGHLPGMED